MAGTIMAQYISAPGFLNIIFHLTLHLFELSSLSLLFFVSTKQNTFLFLVIFRKFVDCLSAHVSNSLQPFPCFFRPQKDRLALFIACADEIVKRR